MILALDDIAVARGGRVLLSSLSLALGAGDAALIAGPNGVGKSSLMRVTAGLLKPFAGRVTRDGTAALLTEAHALDPELPLGDALGFWAAVDGVAPALDALGIGHLADVPVRLLSTGQRRRAGLARVVASGAALWLLDEPANGLDVAAVGLLERLIAGHRAHGGAVMVASHTPLVMPGAVEVSL